MPSERFLAWPRKHSPTFLRRVLRRLRTSRPVEINMETDVLFSYCHERPSDFNHGMQSFWRSFWVGNIYRDVLSTKFLIWSTNAIEVVLVFSETRFWAENLFTGVTGDTGVNMCLHHARNRIAVQNNALISTIIFTLKQVYWFCQLSAM